MWGLEPSQQYENFFSIIVLQFVVCPPGPLWWGYRLYGRANGNHLQEDLCHTLCLPGWLLLVPLSPRKATADPHLCRRPSNTHRQVWLSLLCESLLLSHGSWCPQGFVCALQESLFPPVLWKFCNQIPLSFKVRFPGDSLSPCEIPRLGSLMRGLESSQQRENFLSFLFSSLGHPPGRS